MEQILFIGLFLLLMISPVLIVMAIGIYIIYKNRINNKL